MESLASPQQTLLCSDAFLFVCFIQFMWLPFLKLTDVVDTMQVVDDRDMGDAKCAMFEVIQYDATQRQLWNWNILSHFVQKGCSKVFYIIRRDTFAAPD